MQRQLAKIKLLQKKTPQYYVQPRQQKRKNENVNLALNMKVEYLHIEKK